MWYLSQNLALKMDTNNEISITQWLDNLLARGAFSFSKGYLHKEFPAHSDIAVKRALNRLSRKGKIISLYKGYYLIIPVQYASRGILPPPLYLDVLMKHLQRPYYVALLNAAVYHGASHQQPQEFFVMTDFPVIRSTQKKGLKINYISVRKFPDLLIERRKTEAGYINISNAVLTACDLIQFEKRVGGLNRVATVLNELIEVINPVDFTQELIWHVHMTTLQRFGFLLDTIGTSQQLADELFGIVKQNKLNYFRIPLKASKPTKGFSSDNRWKVIVNTEIERDQ